MIHRHLTDAVRDALADTPVVLINGPRQVGKSTLAQWIAAEVHHARYVTLDDAAALTAASRDPLAFVQGFEGPTVIDEVQRAPNVFRALKIVVDRDRRAGRFLLTGSANVLLLPRLSESLAGRMEILTLRPFSAGEIDGRRDGFVDAVFARKFAPDSGHRVSRPDLLRRITTGGFPEVVARPAPQRRRAWFGAYITTLLQRDIRELANIEGLTEMPRLLELAAAQATGLVNFASLARDMAVSQPTLKRYLTLLEAAFLLEPVRAWAASLSKRLIKTPKLFLLDTGLLAHLLGLGPEVRETAVGPLLESFLAQELRKQISWSTVQPRLYYYRTAAGREVDFVLEDASRRIVGIEVKASATIDARDLKGLEDLAATARTRFLRGCLFYTGSETVNLGTNLHAVPLPALWRTG